MTRHRFLDFKCVSCGCVLDFVQKAAFSSPNARRNQLVEAIMSQNHTLQGWTTSGGGRGTLDIVWTCLFTIFLCCWTSLCVNVPPLNSTWVHRLREKLKLALLGILGPDFLIILALGQWESAHRSVEVYFPRDDAKCFASADIDR